MPEHRAAMNASGTRFHYRRSRGYALVDLPSHLRIDRAAVSVVKPPFLMRFLRFRFLVVVLWLLPASLCLLRKSRYT